MQARWKFFGDFEKQAIYGSNAEISIGEAILTRLGKPPLVFTTGKLPQHAQDCHPGAFVGCSKPGVLKIGLMMGRT